MIAPEHGSMSIARTVIAPEDQLEVPASIYNTDSRIWKSWVFGNHLLRPVEVPGGAYTILLQGNLSNPS